MKNIDLYQKLAQICLDNGQTEKAIQTFQRVLEIDPGNLNAVEGITEQLIARNLVSTAIDVVLNAIPSARTSVEEKKHYRSLGDLYLRSGNHRKAIETFEKLNRMESDLPNVGKKEPEINVRKPENAEDTPSVWNEFGLVMNKVGSYDDAVEAFQKGISLDPSLPFLHLNLAQVLVLQGKLSEAMDEYDLAYNHTDDRDGKNAILKRMIAVFKLDNQQELIDITNEIITALAVHESKQNGGYMILPIGSIIPPESEIDENLFNDLISSVKTHGIIHPLVISPEGNTEKFSIIAGKKRYLAAKLAGLTSLPCIAREVSDIEKIEIAFHENLHNAVNDPLSAVEQYEKLYSDHDLTIEGIAKTAGVSSFSVANRFKAVGSRSASENKLLALDEKIFLERMIGNLKEAANTYSEELGSQRDVKADKFIINDKLFDSENQVKGALWYMEGTPTSSVSEPIRVNFSSLFSRASGILKANPQKQKALA